MEMHFKCAAADRCPVWGGHCVSARIFSVAITVIVQLQARNDIMHVCRCCFVSFGRRKCLSAPNLGVC